MAKKVHSHKNSYGFSFYSFIHILNFTGHSRQLKTPRKQNEFLETQLNLAVPLVSIISATSVVMARNFVERH